MPPADLTAQGLTSPLRRSINRAIKMRLRILNQDVFHVGNTDLDSALFVETTLRTIDIGNIDRDGSDIRFHST